MDCDSIQWKYLYKSHRRRDIEAQRERPHRNRSKDWTYRPTSQEYQHCLSYLLKDTWNRSFLKVSKVSVKINWIYRHYNFEYNKFLLLYFCIFLFSFFIGICLLHIIVKFILGNKYISLHHLD